MSNSTHFDIPLNVITKIISEAIPDELEGNFIKSYHYLNFIYLFIFVI